MKLSDKIQEKLKIGSWIFDDIICSYQDQLRKKINLQNLNKNISELCLAYYKHIDITETTLQSSDNNPFRAKISASAKKAIQEIITSEHPNASIGVFDSSIENKLNMAMNCIYDSSPDLFKIVKKNINLFLKVNNAAFRSASHPHLFGVILIGEGINEFSPEQIAVSIIHELAHQELFLINLVDRLVNKSFDLHEIHAPFQGKNRPPIGRLHSLWALFRMIDFQSTLNITNAKYRDLLLKNIDAFDDDELTQIGSSLVTIAKARAS